MEKLFYFYENSQGDFFSFLCQILTLAKGWF